MVNKQVVHYSLKNDSEFLSTTRFVCHTSVKRRSYHRDLMHLKCLHGDVISVLMLNVIKTSVSMTLKE